MSRFRLVRVALIACILASLTLANGFGTSGFEEPLNKHLPVNPVTDESDPPLDSLASTSTYFAIRRDLRRCASPRCGGYFVSRVNQRRTRCSDGRLMMECYVAEIDWNGHSQADSDRLLVRGDLNSRVFPRLGRFGVLRAREVWQAATEKLPSGDFYRVRDRGVRCITHPCLSHHQARLNATASREIAGVELNGVGASEDRVSAAFKAMTEPDGIIVSGSPRQVSGPGGRAMTLDASQFYLQSGNSVSQKPCIKTGCSRQVCAEEEVVTTCEYRREYDCYKTARCERQANGECGFTRTPELTSCLNRAR